MCCLASLLVGFFSLCSSVPCTASRAGLSLEQDKPPWKARLAGLAQKAQSDGVSLRLGPLTGPRRAQRCLLSPGAGAGGATRADAGRYGQRGVIMQQEIESAQAGPGALTGMCSLTVILARCCCGWAARVGPRAVAAVAAAWL